MYSVIPYFMAKFSSEIPGFFIVPTLLTVLTYFILGLSLFSWSKLAIFWLIAFAIFINAAGMGMFIGSLFASKQVAVSMTPIMIVPLMLFAGFFVNQNNIPIFLWPLQYISIFKYGFQAFFIVSFRPCKRF